MSFVALLLPLIPMTPLGTEDGEVWRAHEQEIQALRARFLEGGCAFPLSEGKRRNPALPLFSFLSDTSQKLHLRVTTLEEPGCSALSSLLEALTPPLPLRVRNRPYFIQEVDLAPSPWTGISTWADFLAPPIGETIRLHLLTPLILPKGRGALKGASRTFLHLTSCLACWRASGKSLVGQRCLATSTRCRQRWKMAALSSPIIACRHRRSSSLEKPGLDFAGGFVPVPHEKDAQRLTLTALARFAFFLGIGADEPGHGGDPDHC